MNDVEARLECLRLLIGKGTLETIVNGYVAQAASDLASFVLYDKVVKRGVQVEISDTETGKIVTLRRNGVEHRVEFVK